MKKLLALLLALSLMVSVFAVGVLAEETDTTNPYIVSVVAISDTKIDVTISEPIYVKQTGCWALFFAKDGVIDTSTRIGGTVNVTAGTLCDNFTWTVESGSITDRIAARCQAGYEAYFGINTNNTYLEISAERATDKAGNMFLKNMNTTSYSVHVMPIDPYYNAVRSISLVDEMTIDIEFWYPIEEFVDAVNGVLLIGAMNANKTDFYVNADAPITTTKRLTPTVTENGTLRCTLSENLAGMPSGDQRNIAKYVQTINATYAENGYVAGVKILEMSTAQKNDGVLEAVVAENGVALRGPLNTSGRAFCMAAISSETAKIGLVKYDSLDAAMASAKSGDTIELIRFAKSDDKVFVLDAGVTLDLNGYSLTVNNVLTFGDIVDSTEGDGKLIPAANARVILNTENKALPVFDTDGYRFFTYEFKSAGPKNGTANSVQFGAQILFENVEAYALLAQDANIAVDMKLSVEKDGKTTDLTFTFSNATLVKYANTWETRDNTATTTPTMVLTVSGINAVDAISCTPVLSQSATTVSQTAALLPYTPAV